MEKINYIDCAVEAQILGKSAAENQDNLEEVAHDIVTDLAAGLLWEIDTRSEDCIAAAGSHLPKNDRSAVLELSADDRAEALGPVWIALDEAFNETANILRQIISEHA